MKANTHKTRKVPKTGPRDWRGLGQSTSIVCTYIELIHSFTTTQERRGSLRVWEMGWEFLLRAEIRKRKSVSLCLEEHDDTEAMVLGPLLHWGRSKTGNRSERRKSTCGKKIPQFDLIFWVFPLLDRFSNISAAFQGGLLFTSLGLLLPF